MPIFIYKARTKEGEIRSGVIETSSKDSAVEILQRRNLLVISVEEKEISPIFGLQIGGGVRQKDIVIFSRQLATLFEAEIPVLEALRTLTGETTRPALKKIVAQIHNDVSGGMVLSGALAKHPKVFSPFYINLVRAGEEAGKLHEVFSYLADYLERSYYLTSKAKNSLIYPAFVLTAFVAVIIVMLVVVMPRLISVFEEVGQPIPFYTQVVMALSTFLRKRGLLLVILLVGGVFVLWRWSLTRKGRLFLHKFQLKIPIVGELYRKLYMARLTDNLQTMITAGIPILRALDITGGVVGNEVYKKSIEDAIESVKGGNTISSAFEKNPEIPVLVTQMIKIGEVSGRLEFILKSIAKFYTKEVNSMVENLVSLIEPVLIVFLGIGVGFLVASVLVPLYNLVGAF